MTTDFGKIIATVGCLEVYDPITYDEQQVLTNIIFGKLKQVATAANNQYLKPFHAVLFDDKSSTVSSIALEELWDQRYTSDVLTYYNRNFDMRVAAPDLSANLEGTIGFRLVREDTYEIVSPLTVHILGGYEDAATEGLDFQVRNTEPDVHVRWYGDDEKALANRNSPEYYVSRFISRIKGNFVDPFAAIYGTKTENDILRLVLGEENVLATGGGLYRIVKDKIYISEIGGSAMAVRPLNKQDELTKAREDLTDKLWQDSRLAKKVLIGLGIDPVR